MNIAFIGLGNMGLPMARNLLKAGHALTGFDLSAAALDALVAAGGTRAASANEAVLNADVVVSMLPASVHVQALYLGDAGLLNRLRPGTLVIDCSTISAAVARELGNAANAQGLDMIDAPVSGGTLSAEAGTLTFMTGGTESQVERARPVLQAMGKKILHAGGNGAGQAAKACNNMLLGIIMVGTSEALQLGLAQGLDPKVLSDIIGNSSGANWLLSTNNPCPGTLDTAPSARGYSGGFAGDLMLKDLGLAMDAALATGVSVPLGATARNLYSMHSVAGKGRLDFGSIFHSLSPRRT